MRLKKDELKWIKILSKKYFGTDCNIWIFGSRVDDTQKGGDIDIFVETKLNSTLSDKIVFLRELETAIGEQKVDLIVKTPKSQPKDIYETARREGIVI
ncbi:MAG: hypothetical protein IEMM0008_0670 [bacterium]|nr:MAG: hypothetical protein IEMM0008_0670 [bacterium]